jgi:hypothetical protein
VAVELVQLDKATQAATLALVVLALLQALLVHP